MNLSFLNGSVATDIFARLAESLLHFVWQGTVLAAIVLVVDRFLRGCSAQLRYTVHLAALMLMLACVPVTYAVLERHPKGESVVAASTADKELTASRAAVTHSRESAADEVPFATDRHPKVADVTPPQSTSKEQTWDRLRTVAHSAAPYAVCAYLLGVALMFGRLALALMGGHRLCSEARLVTDANLLAMVAKQARKIGLRTAPIVAWCGRTSVPLVAGLVKPMILLPVALASSLTPDQLEAILAHELAHLRRFDLLVNLLQRVAEALLFFHPAVWYVSRRISSEREHCCDDSVLRAGWSRVEYADALVRMAEICAPARGISGLNAAAILAAAGDNPSQFKQRVMRLLGEQESLRLGVSRGMAVAILAGVLAILLAIPALFSAPSLVAQNKKNPPPSDNPAKNDREPETLPGHYRVSFRETPWQEVLKWYERVMGDPIEVKTVPSGNVNYESPRPLDHREISLLINSELLNRGFCLSQEGKGFSVQPADVIARQYAEQFRKEFMHGGELRKGKDKFESYFEIVDCRIAGQTKPPAPSGPAIAYLLKASRDFSAQEATAFLSACFADVSMPSLKTGQIVLADGFAVLHDGKWLGKKAPALQKGEQIEVWQNYAQEWNSRPPQDYHLVIEGSIVGEGGKPVAAARVQQLLLEEAPDGPEGEKLKEFLNWAYGGELVVDKEGKFQVSLHHGSQFVRKAYLHVSAPGYAPQRIGPIAIGHDKPAASLKIELKPGFSGRLRLVLPDGKRLVKGEVEVTVQDDVWSWDRPMGKLPVGDEPITVPNCPAGPLLLKVRVPGFAEQEIRDVQLVADKVVEVKVDPKPKEAKPKEVFYFRGKEALERIENVKPAWSESQNGIEFGIARIGNRSRFYSGERVPLEMFIRNTGKETVKVQLAADFLANVPEVKNDQGEAVKVESVFATGSVALYRETLKPGEAFGFRHLGLGLGPNPAPGKENWIPFCAEPKAGHATLRHTHEIDVEPADESKPGTRAKFTSGVIHISIAPADEAKPPRDGVHRYALSPRQKDVVIEQNYKDGQLHGPTRMFVRGELSQDQNYREGKLDGFVRTYEKGKVVEEGSWKEGKLDGFNRLYEEGKLVGETFYKNGQPEGAAFVRSSTYKMNGQYLNGEPEGAWISERVGQWKLTANYKNGLLDGLWERKTSDGKVIRLTYDQGQLVDQGEDVKSFAFLKKSLLLAKDGDPIAKRVKDALHADVDLDYPGTPAAEVVADLYERFSMPIFVDSQATDVPGIGEKKIVVNRRQIPIFLGLHEIAAGHGLTFDYRFHALWLTTPKAVVTWKDTTGVSDLKPAAGSPLAKALPELPKFDLLSTPIAKLAELLQKEYDLTLDASRAPEAKWTGWRQPSLSFRDSLSILLYQNNCRCREEGGKLIIEPVGMPPKENVEPAKENSAGLRINVPALGPAPVALDFAFPVNRDGVAPGAGLRLNVPALGPTPVALDFAFPVNSKSTDPKQSFCFFFGVLR